MSTGLTEATLECRRSFNQAGRVQGLCQRTAEVFCAVPSRQCMHRAQVAWHHGKASVQAPRHGSQGRPHTLSLLTQGIMEGSMGCSHLQQRRKLVRPTSSRLRSFKRFSRPRRRRRRSRSNIRAAATTTGRSVKLGGG